MPEETDPNPVPPNVREIPESTWEKLWNSLCMDFEGMPEGAL